MTADVDSCIKSSWSLAIRSITRVPGGVSPTYRAETLMDMRVMAPIRGGK